MLFDGFNGVRQPQEKDWNGSALLPGELAPRLSLGAWLWVLSQSLWVPTLLRGAETVIGSMSSWLIKNNSTFGGELEAGALSPTRNEKK